MLTLVSLAVAFLVVCLAVVGAFAMDRHRPLVRKQFGVRLLLGLTVILAIWASQLSLSPVNRGESFGPSWPEHGAVFFAWFALAIIYLSLRLRGWLALHCGGLLFFGTFGLCCTLGGRHPSTGEPYLLVVLGCFFGTFVSVPGLLLMMAVQWVKAARGTGSGGRREGNW